LAQKFALDQSDKKSLKSIFSHSITNSSVLMVLGSFVIGIISDSKHAEGIKPFTTDIFKGFLAIFLLEMGMKTAKRIGSFRKYGLFLFLFALLMPLVTGSFTAFSSIWVTDNIGNRFMFAILAASASYIAVPAAVKLALPKADPGLFIPMALGITFPFNITVGMPIYLHIVQSF
jgi:hypothetical protein